ncbi:HD domain-containing phosphohydrolase [Vibrio sp. TRT 17S01]|uniref:HD domain-containing phosphohydrolase n=2 Tax=unclassified Vibrio TaxID=2614977 RepID=UPI003CF27275
MEESYCFAEESSTLEPITEKFWEILVVDDEQDVHDVTNIVLGDCEFLGRKLHFTHAYSAKEAREQIENAPHDFAVILLDVVMETRQAGLDLVKWIRDTKNNKSSRIILRTGQPGDAPEEQVILTYDINDYKNKTELTSTRLITTTFAAIRSYSDIITIEQTRAGLKTIINSTSDILVENTSATWLQGILRQIVALLKLDDLHAIHYGASPVDGQWRIVATTNGDKCPLGDELSSYCDVAPAQFDFFRPRLHHVDNNTFVLPISVHDSNGIIVVKSNEETLEQHRELIELFIKSATIAYDKMFLINEVVETQKEIAYRLGEVVETRSKESGSHVKRLSLLSHLLAKNAGLSDDYAEKIKLASPLHDIGKIAIPDNILHKPGKLSAEEWEIMKTHAAVGAEILAGSNLEILRIAAIIASSHHEKWDGSGYPSGLTGEDIPIEGRITAIIDVFDALASKRCYKEPWAIDDIKQHFLEQKGQHFDPKLCDVFLSIFDECIELRDAYPD